MRVQDLKVNKIMMLFGRLFHGKPIEFWRTLSKILKWLENIENSLNIWRTLEIRPQGKSFEQFCFCVNRKEKRNDWFFEKRRCISCCWVTYWWMYMTYTCCIYCSSSKQALWPHWIIVLVAFSQNISFQTFSKNLFILKKNPILVVSWLTLVYCFNLRHRLRHN